MNFNELHPNIQSWLDSDEFINAIVSVVQTFALPNSSSLVSAVFDLAMKQTKPEEFKDKLFSTLPQDKQKEEVVNKLVSSTLLPISTPLAESGIDISIIVPLNEEVVVPTTSANPPSQISTDALINTASPLSINENIAPTIDPISAIPSPSPLSSTQEFSPQPDVTPASIPEPLSSPLPNVAPILITDDTNNPLIEHLPHPSSTVTLITPNFTHPKDSAVPNVAPAPFVIYKETPIERSSSSHKEGPLRPIFYSAEPVKQREAPTASIEFGAPAQNNEVNPDNIINLKDLPL